MPDTAHMYELDPALDYIQIPPNQLVFRGPAGGFTIHDKMGLIKSTVDCIKAERSLDEAFAGITSEQDRDTAKQHILGMLEARGVIRKSTSLDNPDRDMLQAWLRFVGRDKHAEPVVGLMGDGTLANCIGAELTALGIRHFEIEGNDFACDIGVFCQDAAGETALRQANKKFVEAGVPYLPVSIDRHIVSKGPMIIPGATACAECAHHRRQMSLGPDAQQIPDLPSKHSGFTIRLAAMFAVEELLRFVYGASYDLHTATQTRYSVVTGRSKHSVILKVPRCPACGPKKIRMRPLSDTFNRSSVQTGAFVQ